ncbi:hypothetical protein SNOG_08553 [Parastagonospora nodorum SN15]|uniref:Uncharacterized protein n=1 Tax=Phaeosphaeria nodorum (strain SN15 / ATCC MYA-4574 / FGSC 10173) TaxID=321614 RepID=Q0UI61_PHANO|nr:hypothetical protein SNOG_08553 [Parastagonospora nodorum SN15]EAT83721.1 hypothetical protein SNOG_08553 [Parastagonospora nodorum SN15]
MARDIYLEDKSRRDNSDGRHIACKRQIVKGKQFSAAGKYKIGSDIGLHVAL